MTLPTQFSTTFTTISQFTRKKGLDLYADRHETPFLLMFVVSNIIKKEKNRKRFTARQLLCWNLLKYAVSK